MGRRRGGRNGRGGRGGRGCGGVRVAKPDIAARSCTDQEWELLIYDEKVKVFALRDKAEPRQINGVEISELSITKIANIAAGQNTGLEAAGEIEITGKHITYNTCGST